MMEQISLIKRVEDTCKRFFFSEERETLEKSIATPNNTSSNNDILSIIARVNEALFLLEEEISFAHNLIVDCFSIRFPELPSLNLARVDYLRTVRLYLDQAVDDTEHQTNALASLDFAKVLSPPVALAAALAAGTTTGKSLKPSQQKDLSELVTLEEQMLNTRQKLLYFVESQMGSLAPNVTAIVGPMIAGQLVAATGSISALAMVPAGNIRVIGRASHKELAGFSLSQVDPHAGFLASVDLVCQIDAPYRIQAQRLLANKVALAARIDTQRQWPDGQYGRRLRSEIIERLEKLMEPAHFNQPKLIPPPPIEASKRRGGRRVRRQKELYTQTKTRKLANRMDFGTPEEEIIVGANVVGLGQLSGTGDGGSRMGRASLRTPVMDSRLREHIKKQSKKAYARALQPQRAFPLDRIPVSHEDEFLSSQEMISKRNPEANTPPQSSGRFIGTNLSFKQH